MTIFSKRALWWTPRVLSILFIAFVSLFALDVFNEGYGFWRTLQALAMHLIPSFALIAILALAWRWEWIGAVFYGAAGFLYVGSTVARRLPVAIKWNWISVIAGPAFVIAALFLLCWLNRRSLRLVQ